MPDETQSYPTADKTTLLVTCDRTDAPFDHVVWLPDTPVALDAETGEWHRRERENEAEAVLSGYEVIVNGLRLAGVDLTDLCPPGRRGRVTIQFTLDDKEGA